MRTHVPRTLSKVLKLPGPKATASDACPKPYTTKEFSKKTFRKRKEDCVCPTTPEKTIERAKRLVFQEVASQLGLPTANIDLKSKNQK